MYYIPKISIFGFNPIHCTYNTFIALFGRFTSIYSYILPATIYPILPNFGYFATYFRVENNIVVPRVKFHSSMKSKISKEIKC